MHHSARSRTAFCIVNGFFFKQLCSPAGKLCTANGLKEPDMDCPGGYLCLAGSSSLDSALVCPVGFVCVEGAVDALSCPRGTFGPHTGFGSQVQCRPCTGGSYCDGTTPESVTGSCSPGFYCKEGSKSRWNMLCPAGKVCPEGSASPDVCPPGFSTFVAGAAECTKCAAGTRCELGLPTPCERGSYCEAGQGQQACPAGTYMPFEGSTSLTACLPCPAGEKRKTNETPAGLLTCIKADKSACLLCNRLRLLRARVSENGNAYSR